MIASEELPFIVFLFTFRIGLYYSNDLIKFSFAISTVIGISYLFDLFN